VITHAMKHRASVPDRNVDLDAVEDVVEIASIKVDWVNQRGRPPGIDCKPGVDPRAGFGSSEDRANGSKRRPLVDA
jgi:hypothetical protein